MSRTTLDELEYYTQQGDPWVVIQREDLAAFVRLARAVEKSKEEAVAQSVFFGTVTIRTEAWRDVLSILADLTTPTSATSPSEAEKAPKTTPKWLVNLVYASFGVTVATVMLYALRGAPWQLYLIPATAALLKCLWLARVQREGHANLKR